MQLEFVTQSSRNDADWTANSERLVNLYAEPIPEGGRARIVLRPVLGMEEWVQLAGVFVRAMGSVSEREAETGAIVDRLFVVLGGQLYQITATGGVTARGEVGDCPRTTLAGNNGAVTVACGGRYYVWNGTALIEPDEGAFSDVGAVEFLGGYTILTERNGRRFQWSALADATDLPGLNFASAEGSDDALVRPVAINGNLWLFKERSTEIWGLTGQASENAFARLGGGVRERGLLGFNLIAKVPDGAFFVGNDGICYITNGAEFTPVSRTPVESAIEQQEPTDCFYYEDEGHKFCVVRFAGRPAWVYDLSTGLWHERATGLGAWIGTGAVYAFGKWRVASSDGRVSTLLRNGRDVGQPLFRQATSRTLQNDGARFRVPILELLAQMGRTDIGRDAQMLVEFSRDGGNSWGAQQARSLGNLGDYSQRVVFRNLGQTRQLTMRVTMTDPADLRLWSAANVVVA
jgi:hypothetical protein